MNLSELKSGQSGVIAKVRGRGAFRKRIIEMGFVAGKTVEVIKKAPLQDPVEYRVMGYSVSLRNSEAELIEVVPGKSDDSQDSTSIDNGAFLSNQRQSQFKTLRKTINVALVGNPNSGKTTFFNFASGSKERVGNYGGVTVDAKEATFNQSGYKFMVTDLPGTYSITAYTPEEIFVRDFIQGKVPDVVINMVDASNLERNLYLTTQLIDMDIKVVIALNMFDELEQKGDKLDYASLGSLLGIPIVPTVSKKGKGIKETFEKVIEVYEDNDPNIRHIHINYGTPIEDSIKRIQDLLKIDGNQGLTSRVSPRFLAIKLLENDSEAVKSVNTLCLNRNQIIEVVSNEALRLEREFREEPETLIADLKYGFINGALKETLKPGKLNQRQTTKLIDGVITHRIWGFPIFLFIMWLMFTSTFTLGEYPMGLIESGVDAFSGFLDSILPNGAIKDLFVGGIIGGAGAVLMFLPNILLLFLFISLMEGTGYMARAVFIMDKVLHKIGLHGQSFVPLIMGFGCNVPAIMATRTLPSRNDRLLTMLINPFMSCSARLPIYVLFISAFFPNHQGSMLFLMYLIGIFIAVIVSMIFKKTLFREQEIPFVMELPPYRVPTTRYTMMHMWGKGVHYIKKISGIVLVASIIIWVLGYFPYGNTYREQIESQQSEMTLAFNQTLASHSAMADEEMSNLRQELEVKLKAIEARNNAERLERSFIGQLGRIVQPIMAPLGFDWKMTIGIITGVAAKEIVISTLGVLYLTANPEEDEGSSLKEKLQAQVHTGGPKIGETVFNKVVAFSYMIFILLYFPCIAVIAAISRESGSWKWGLFAIVYTTSIAWVVSFAVYQIGSLVFA